MATAAATTQRPYSKNLSIKEDGMNTRCICLCIALVSVAFVKSASAMEPKFEVEAPVYVDAREALSEPGEIDAWYQMLHGLREDFDQICGDTFCEGDYSNIQALRLVCSLQRSNRVIRQCVWTFAASHEEINPDNGRISVEPKVWRCKLPLAPKTTLSALLGAVSQQRPLYAKLPGTQVSIYDGLTECL